MSFEKIILLLVLSLCLTGKNELRAIDTSSGVTDDTAKDLPCRDFDIGLIEKGWSRDEVLWKGVKTLTVSFLGGDEQLHGKVMKFACGWNEYSGLKFEKAASGVPGIIRVAFDQEGHYSIVGRYAEKVVDTKKKTMNLQLTGREADWIIKMIVLHEFGHALGLMHEHQSPLFQVKWNEEEIYREFSGPPNNWDRKQIRSQIIERYQLTPSTKTSGSTFDKTSIMLYPISKKMTLDGYHNDWNHDLSAEDKKFIALLYPLLEAQSR